MDCEDFEGSVAEAARVLKTGGLLFASVLHPCFDGNHEYGIGRQGSGLDRQVVVMNYFEPKTWEAPLWRGKTPVVWRHRTMQEYVETFSNFSACSFAYWIAGSEQSTATTWAPFFAKARE